MPNHTLPHDHGNEKRAVHLKEKLDRAQDFSAAAEMMSLLSDSSRLRIFWLLCHCEECVVNISAMTEMSSPAVSHHLRILKDGGLIVSRRDGREVYYTAADSPQCRLLHGTVEKLMELSGIGLVEGRLMVSGYSESQIDTVRRMHDELVANPETRLTIEELAKKYLMNPTTLKEAFKAVYGDSLASHIKTHRMEKAAELLMNTEDSVASIASAVGYESPSRFSAAFKERYHMLPAEYRKHRK